MIDPPINTEESNLTGSATLMRLLNRTSIIDLIRENREISRSEISRNLNISLPTVMRIVDELIECNLVINEEKVQPSGGRPRALVSFNAKGHAVIGIDLGGTKMYGTIADIGGNILKEIYLPWDHAFPDSQKSLQSLFDLIDRLMEFPRPAGQLLRGIVVGAPAITYYPEGIVKWAPSLGWRDFPLQEILSDRYNIPVRVDNDVNLAALGEAGFGAGKGVKSLVCINIGTGIGSGIVIDREIYRGVNQSAGEIGYLLPGVEFVGKPFNVFGALESLASGAGIAQRSKELLSEMVAEKENGHPSAEDVFNAARKQEPWAQTIINETIDYYCLAVGAVSSILDPEMIILGGGVSRSADLLIKPILERLDGVIPVKPNLVASQLGYRASVMGAIMLIFDIITDHIKVSQF